MTLTSGRARPTTRDSPGSRTRSLAAPPSRDAPGGVTAAPPQPAHTQAARRLQLGTGAGREPLATGEGKRDGSLPLLDTHPMRPHRAHARERTRHQAAHTGSPRRRTARPGPAGPSPDSERGGAGRGRRKSRRTAPTRGEPADPFPPRLPPREVDARGGDSCLRRHSGGASGCNAHKAGTANGDSDTPHEARPFTDR